jgi:hydrogenase nickel incorporation protein HypA/HybF
MHELAITQSILDIALENAHKIEAGHITGINLIVGQMASVVDDSIQFYWDILSEGTIAKGALIKIQRIPMQMHCVDCGNTFLPGSQTFDCPECNSIRVQVKQGDELRVESIDVED